MLAAMWFYPLVLTLVILAIIGGVLAGGVFTIVLIPVAGLALISAIGYTVFARGAQQRAGAAEGGSALPHQPEREPGHVQTSPEGLADARRVQQ